MTWKPENHKPVLWHDAEVGEKVSLTRAGRTEYTGVVDAKTAEGEVVWVHNPVGGRRLFHIRDGFDLKLNAD
ncbi:hypothetical protein [Pseudarthrobacter sp. NamE5]|uniref:hypothetical protein n=1 Tax=Pseudarthrobacter sp. NamE5 TaxID=2576839 RepID=UPI00110A594E|nr:hypothetical protein [Pseudarthrobacter sp. NamE5]TLM88201.1 hypothetical protein FDW84_01390 [Pseudarthrobacter sp. NamE5]